MELRKITKLAMLLAVSVVLSLIESFIPFFSGVVPGLKIGLANIVVVFSLYYFSFKDALLISVLRVFIMGLLMTGVFSVTFYFSLGGALLSIISMAIIKKTHLLSIIGVSIVGSVCHSLGQVIVAILILRQTAMIYYLPWLLLFSIPTGIVVGFFSQLLLKYYKNIEISF